MIKDAREGLEFIAECLGEIENRDTWVIPFSGGKDSSAVAASTLHLIGEGIVAPPARVVIYMADTLLEFDRFEANARAMLLAFETYGNKIGLDVRTFTTMPLPQDSFWVRICGRGFLPPTPGMRTCTDKLKITPPRKILRRLGWDDAPVLLGVRFGESERRDKMLTCSTGGECGPDALYRSLKRSRKHRHRVVTPVLELGTCAIWGILLLLDQFDFSTLVELYGPEGTLRYGCWCCPLIFNDRAGEFLAKDDPKLLDLIYFTDRHLRRGGDAFSNCNREVVRKKDGLGSGLLKVEYCRRLFSWMLEFEHKHGVELLRSWEKRQITAMLAWREDLPDIQSGDVFQPPLFGPMPLHISQAPRWATALVAVNLVNDWYHQSIKRAAERLVERSRHDWVYGGQHRLGTTWWSAETINGRITCTVRPNGDIMI